MPDGKVQRESADFWEDFMNFSIDDVSDDSGNVNYSFDILKQISETNPELKTIIDTAIAAEGKPANIDQINHDTAESLRSLLNKFVPDEERGIEKTKAARRDEPQNTGRETGAGTGGAETETESDPETYQTTTGTIEPKDQGRVGRIGTEPESEPTEEPVQIDADGNYIWKGKTYKKKSFKPPGLYTQLRKQGIIKEEITYRDFFQF
jgi:hypothetical protein